MCAYLVANEWRATDDVVGAALRGRPSSRFRAGVGNIAHSRRRGWPRSATPTTSCDLWIDFNGSVNTPEFCSVIYDTYSYALMRFAECYRTQRGSAGCWGY
jgi:hypothetical protein